MLVKDRANVFIVPSFDEAFVNIVTRQLFSFAGEYDIFLYGMPSWIDMNTIRLNYLDSLNLRYTVPYNLNRQSERYQHYEKGYINTFHGLPSETSIKAFDLTVFFGRMLQKYGLTFWHTFRSPTTVKGLTTRFNFQPRYDSTTHVARDSLWKGRIIKEKDYRILRPDSSIQFFENKSVYLMYYNNFKRISLDN